MSKRTRKPVIGDAFTSDPMDSAETLRSMVTELEYYGPRRFAGEIERCGVLLAEFERGAMDANWLDRFEDVIDDSCEALSAWAQRFNPYLRFGVSPHEPETFGFSVDVEGAQEDADLTVDDTNEVPRGFSGLVVHVNDHGNVTAYRYARGRSYELFAVV